MKRILTALLFLLTALFARADGRKVTVAVFCLNDFHSGFARDAEKEMPGAAAVWQTLDSLKAVYPYHVTVSAGDNFGGSYFHSATRGALLPYFFAGCGIALSAVGNHEFDDGQDFFNRRWADAPLRPDNWTIDYVGANVRDASGRLPLGILPAKTVSVPLGPSGDSVRVAFVGLTTHSTHWQASKSRIKDLYFDRKYRQTLDSLRQTPAFAPVAAADVRLLLMHVGTAQDSLGASRWIDPAVDDLAALDDTTWHALFTSHTHQPVCGRIGRYPVTQGYWHGGYIAMMKINFDTDSRRVLSVEPSLVPVRPDIALGPGPRRMEALVDSVLRHTVTAAGTPIGTPLTVVREPITHSRSDKMRQTRMGSLVCEAYARAAARALGDKGDEAMVVGVSHFGSIRTGFGPGRLTVLDVGEALPFANAIRVYAMTAGQLAALVARGYGNTEYGRMQTARFEAVREDSGCLLHFYYVAPDGRRRRIEASDTIYIAADEYMTTGGDGYGPEVFPSACDVTPSGLPCTTDAFIDYLRTLSEI
ncbi:MAG: bifunctional metallophosphatase/5'-nucleotidase [Prevotellaceae bacterium]|nr:bifunctional metallophosphatase/5'-nucleotidase [Prevotellaceae bacterium]